MKKTQIPSYIKTKVVIDFENEEQAKAFFNLFDNPAEKSANGLKLMSEYLKDNTSFKKIEDTKVLKHNYFIKIV